MAISNDILLGKATEYKDQYDPTLLFPIDRGAQWAEQGIDRKQLDFKGEDLWTAYELSWLNPKGVPQVAIAEIRVPADSPHIVESKSFKLYLNSFNQTVVADKKALVDLIEKDLSIAAGASVRVSLLHVDGLATSYLEGECIDDLDIEINQYKVDASSLSTENTLVSEVLVSHILKSNCPVTSQPDWASVQIRYTGNKIDRAGLLRYLISFRTQNDFHEQCVETIYNDIMNQCKPSELEVYARYTRRGGLDINPFRSSKGGSAPSIRLARQ